MSSLPLSPVMRQIILPSRFAVAVAVVVPGIAVANRGAPFIHTGALLLLLSINPTAASALVFGVFLGRGLGNSARASERDDFELAQPMQRGCRVHPSVGEVQPWKPAEGGYGVGYTYCTKQDIWRLRQRPTSPHLTNG
jgi:hypothetical protein